MSRKERILAEELTALVVLLVARFDRQPQHEEESLERNERAGLIYHREVEIGKAQGALKGVIRTGRYIKS